jgi:hypothetical protein
MKLSQIESWALRVLEAVKKNPQFEDSLVELKREWIDAKKAARQIAAHANAARGEPILWLIGVDQTAGIVGANDQELSSWFPQVETVFEGIAPSLQHIKISFEGKIIAALCFDTSRFPFVTKIPEFGTVKGMPEYEVPWREGERTRSAKRNDLILLLNPVTRPPKVEVLAGEIRFVMMATDPISHALQFNLKLYLAPLDNTPLTFPFHRCQAVLSYNGNTISDKFDISLDTPKGKLIKKQERQAQNPIHYYANASPQINVSTGTEIVHATSDEVIFHGPGKIEIDGSYGILTADKLPEMDLAVTLIEAVSEAKVVVNCKFLKREHYDKGLVWMLSPPIRK